MRPESTSCSHALRACIAASSLARVGHAAAAASGYDAPATTIAVSATPDADAGPVLPEAFVSYAFEFSSFPDFAGNSTSGPNLFSDTLLNNIGNITGTKPYIRVGGNTQDYAIWDPNLPVALVGIVNATLQPNYPTNVTIGPSFFESYATWPGCRYVHGFNLAVQSPSDENLLGPVGAACRALGAGDRLLYWEVGNEVDVYNAPGPRAPRPPTWTAADYVREWLDASRKVRARLAQECPGMESDARFRLWAPSFGGTQNYLDPVAPWLDGLDADSNIDAISMHSYMSGYGVPGVTLQGTLLNHSAVVENVGRHLNVSHLLANLSLPYTLTEVNSLYNAGAPGISNVFGGALWTLDYCLWAAASGIARVHLQQGLNFRYASWQPIDTGLAPRQTKPSYYGDVAVASALGDLTAARVRVRNLPLGGDTRAAYATFADDVLRRVTLLNMQTYNYSTAGTAARLETVFAVQLPRECAGGGGGDGGGGGGGGGGEVTVQRLLANGSDVLSGVTFNGVSYNVELAGGRPVVLGNVTRDERVAVGGDGVVRVTVPDASAAMVLVDCADPAAAVVGK